MLLEGIFAAATTPFYPDGRLYLAMELLEGEDLSSLVQRKGPLSTPDACEIARQAAEGLGAAHANGFVHRDVKPANIMLCRNGVVKVLDPSPDADINTCDQ